MAPSGITTCPTCGSVVAPDILAKGCPFCRMKGAPRAPLPPDALGGERYVQNYIESSAKMAAKSAATQIVMFVVIGVVAVVAAIAVIVGMLLWG